MKISTGRFGCNERADRTCRARTPVKRAAKHPDGNGRNSVWNGFKGSGKCKSDGSEKNIIAYNGNCQIYINRTVDELYFECLARVQMELALPCRSAANAGVFLERADRFSGENFAINPTLREAHSLI